ncbi:MAG TPA: DUF551 domain-containing protein [Gammaproteobacteria bacterium]|jgi:hypothetical protein|nr:DUF551 domain-containing protein [Gammaproteobacteria bacterium]
MDWVNIEHRWPKHLQTVLVCCPQGYCVVVFVNSSNMNEDLSKSPQIHEYVDLEKNPYYFFSQEIKQCTLDKVTHWCELPTIKTIKD